MRLPGIICIAKGFWSSFLYPVVHCSVVELLTVRLNVYCLNSKRASFVNHINHVVDTSHLMYGVVLTMGGERSTGSNPIQ